MKNLKKSIRKLKRRKTNKRRKTYKGGSSAPEHAAQNEDLKRIITEKIFIKLNIRGNDKIKREYSTFIGTLPHELFVSIIHALRNPDNTQLKQVFIEHDLGYESEGDLIIKPPPVLQ